MSIPKDSMEFRFFFEENEGVNPSALSNSKNIPHAVLAMGELPQALREEVAEVMQQASEFNVATQSLALALDSSFETNPDTNLDAILSEFAKRKYLSQWLPRAFGGSGYTAFSMLPFNEELATGCLALANIIGAHYVGISLLSATGNLRLLRYVSQQIVEAEKKGVSCILSTAVTEPHAGSDLEDHELVKRAQVTCIATKVKGGYSISGSKVFISNAILASFHVVVAYENPKDPRYSPHVFLVKAGAKGLSLGRQELKMGQHACPASELVFENCFVPDEFVAFAPGQFENYDDYKDYCGLLIDDVLPMSRAGVGALGTGAARATFQIAYDFCVQEKVGDRVLASEEWVQAKLGEMQSNILISRLAYWEANFAASLHGPYAELLVPSFYQSEKKLPKWFSESVIGPVLAKDSSRKSFRNRRLKSTRKQTNREGPGLASFAKSIGSDCAMKNARIAMDLLGAKGFAHSQGLEKILRDAKLLQIYEGTNSLNLLNVFAELAPRHPDVRMFDS